jgi:hypothetical protein
MQVNYTLDVEDAIAWSHHCHARLRGQERSIPVGLWAAIPAVVCLAYAAWREYAADGTSWLFTGNTLTMVLWLHLPVLYLFTLPVSVYLTRKSLSGRRLEQFRQPRRLVIAAEGITLTTAESCDIVPWSMVERIEETDNHMFFVTNADWVHILPRRAFSNTDNLGKFLEQARHYTPVRSRCREH